MQLVEHDPKWNKEYEIEANLIRSVLEDEIIDIQHIGSTAINVIKAKPIIDIAILLAKEEYLQVYTRDLNKIGYVYYPESSSVERLFYRKGNPVKFHLSLTQEGKTSYWQRQIIFRDYLNAHPEIALEYEKLKEDLLIKDPTAGKIYSEGKTEFVRHVLELAE